ncbi:MAG: hypothetical protein J6L92_01755 [Clostridia bacterium]|nr:hypothetical protein [Clostridia bacterium]
MTTEKKPQKLPWKQRPITQKIVTIGNGLTGVAALILFIADFFADDISSSWYYGVMAAICFIYGFDAWKNSQKNYHNLTAILSVCAGIVIIICAVVYALKDK